MTTLHFENKGPMGKTWRLSQKVGDSIQYFVIPVDSNFMNLSS